MTYVKDPLSLRYFEGLLAERWMGICLETVRFLVEQVWPMFPATISHKPGSVDEGVHPLKVTPG